MVEKNFDMYGDEYRELYKEPEKVQKIVIVGGTHGNERNGIFAARHLLKDTKRASRSTFETTVDLANPVTPKQRQQAADCCQSKSQERKQPSG